MTEKLFLEAAALLKLKDIWDYRDLYLGILEEMCIRDRYCGVLYGGKGRQAAFGDDPGTD